MGWGYEWKTHAAYEQKIPPIIYEGINIFMFEGWWSIQWKDGGERVLKMMLDLLLRPEIGGRELRATLIDLKSSSGTITSP